MRALTGLRFHTVGISLPTADPVELEVPVVRSADPHRTALADAWRALWTSRLLIWAAGLYGILAAGFRPGLVTPHDLAPFSTLGNVLVGPAARWDAGWYVSIANHPYDFAQQTAFFPLYPLSMRGLAFVIGSPLVSGILISLVAFLAALYVMHRLAAEELGPDHAPTATYVLAFFPTALFFSAVYAESLLLALTIGAVWAARRGRWAWAGVLAAFASATHNTGVLIGLPLLLMYLYGPRGDAVPLLATRGRLWPRYALRWNVLWLALVPAGMLAFFTYTAIAHGDFLLPVHANEQYWYRHFGILSAIPKGFSAFWHSLDTIGSASPKLLFVTTNGPLRYATGNLVDMGFLVFAVLATIGVLRRLPFAYGAYCLVALVMMLSAPHLKEPLASLPRYIAVLFPMQLWLALWISERRWRVAGWLGGSGLVLGAFAAQFSTWHWVA